jgi:antitoxin ParD1/3/4
MQTMNISLPERLKSYVEEQVGSGRYSTASEYVRELIRNDEKRQAQQKLEEMLLEGVRSGEPREMTAQDWADIRKQGLALLQSKSAGKAS